MILKYLFDKKLSFAAIICIYSVVFIFSHQTGSQSSEMSDNLWIRKLAHISEYTVLSFFVYAYISNISTLMYKKIITSTIISVLLAISDEIHQTFIPGRSGNLVDVFIDSIGIVGGTSISYFLYRRMVRNNI